jgi:Heparinase II/III-like protein/Heparinase II/III N-terminus
MRTGLLAGPGPVVCVIDGQHRDAAVAVAAQRGAFTHGGVTLTLGRHPDWLTGGLAGDEEWRIEWVKLYEGLDLAHRFADTGDPDALTTWMDLVGSFCAQVPVGHDTSDVSARRLQNWLYAWQRFAAAPAFPGLPEPFRHEVCARIRADLRHLEEHLTPERNHRTLELYTLLLFGIALDDRPLATRALSWLAANAARDILDDGVQRERSTDYHVIVLRSLVGAVANARAADLAVPPELLERTLLACDFALHVQRPDGITPAVSDGDQSDFRPLLALAGEHLGRPDLTWAATGGAAGTAPAATHADFPVGGYHVQRSGWGDRGRAYTRERWALLDAGPVGDGGHGHYDQLSLEVAAGGHLLVVDPGRFTYAEDGEGWRRHFKGTAAHSTVCVDGLDQTPYRRGRPKGPVGTARLIARRTRPGLDILVAEARSPAYDAVHTRTVVFVDDDYWLVHDRLRAARPHRYVARWQLAPAAQGATELVRGDDQTAVHAPGLVLAVPRGCGTLAVVDGWVSPRYGVRHPAPAAEVVAEGRAVVDLVTAIVPSRSPVRVAAACRPDGVRAWVQRPGTGVDRLRWTAAPDVVDGSWRRAAW